MKWSGLRRCIWAAVQTKPSAGTRGREERQEGNARFYGIGVEEIVRLSPGRVGERDALRPDARMQPAPHGLELAFDHKLSPGRLRRRARDRTAQRVEAECKKERDCNEEDENSAADPLQSTHNE